MNTRYQKTLAVLGEEKTERETELEETYGDVALAWVQKRNQQTAAAFASTPTFTAIQSSLMAIYTNQKALSSLRLRGDYIYELCCNLSHPKGLWRRTPVAEFKKTKPRWENLFDIDHLPDEKSWLALVPEEQRLANKQGSWIWDTPIIFGDRCMLGLSYGGGDCSIYREFDLTKKQLVPNGLTLEQGDSIRWFDADSLWAVDYDTSRSTPRGQMPHRLKRLRRGETLENATLLYQQEDDEDNMSSATTYRSAEGRLYHVITRCIDYHHNQHYLLYNDDYARLPLDLPTDIEIDTFYQNSAVFTLKSDWHCPDGKHYQRGTVMALHLDTLQDKNKFVVEAIFIPTAEQIVRSAHATRDFLLVNVMHNISGELYCCHFNKRWHVKKMPLHEHGQIEVASHHVDRNDCLITFESFTTPETYYYSDLETQTLEILKSAPATFDHQQIVSHQYWAKSRDGTRVPYYAIHRRDLCYDGNNPALLGGYGGFGDSSLPRYLDTEGPLWLERGGVWLIANIRGGGEFGPAWHQAALKENRHKSFEDFIAVAEDAIQRGLTTAKRLGISGSSNGGLLVAAVATQRPDLFQAVLCNAALLDMVNYTAADFGGKCWIGEYGDPADREMREILRQYSPYHTVSSDKRYPEILFTASTADDRVHPAHSRRMVDRMTAQGHNVFYYETLEGGHANNADFEQGVFSEALFLSYLYQKLMTPAPQQQLSARELRAERRHHLFTVPEMKQETLKPEADRREHKRQKLG